MKLFEEQLGRYGRDKMVRSDHIKKCRFFILSYILQAFLVFTISTYGYTFYFIDKNHYCFPPEFAGHTWYVPH